MAQISIAENAKGIVNAIAREVVFHGQYSPCPCPSPKCKRANEKESVLVCLTLLEQQQNDSEGRKREGKAQTCFHSVFNELSELVAKVPARVKSGSKQFSQGVKFPV